MRWSRALLPSASEIPVGERWDTGRSSGDISSGPFPRSSALLLLSPCAKGHRAAISTCPLQVFHPPAIQDPSGCTPGEPAPRLGGFGTAFSFSQVFWQLGRWGRGVHAWLRIRGNLKAFTAKLLWPVPECSQTGLALRSFFSLMALTREFSSTSKLFPTFLKTRQSKAVAAALGILLHPTAKGLRGLRG